MENIRWVRIIGARDSFFFQKNEKIMLTFLKKYNIIKMQSNDGTLLKEG